MASSPSYALAQDPAYLAFLRASGLTEAVATADAARRRDAVNMALGIQTDDLNASGEQERKGISNSQEDRGVFRSGQTLQRNSDQESTQARRRSALELAASGQLGDIDTNLASTIANQQIRGAEIGLSQAGNAALAYGSTQSQPADSGYQFAPLPLPGAAVPAATSTPRSSPTYIDRDAKRGQSRRDF